MASEAGYERAGENMWWNPASKLQAESHNCVSDYGNWECRVQKYSYEIIKMFIKTWESESDEMLHPGKV